MGTQLSIVDFRKTLNLFVIDPHTGRFKKNLDPIDMLDFKSCLLVFLELFEVSDNLKKKIEAFRTRESFSVIEASSILALLATIEKPVRFSAN